MTRAFVGLGSNLPPRETWLRRAAAQLHPYLLALSPVYESLPVGPVQDQPPFLNAVALLSWTGSAHGLLERCLAVEAELGRVRTVPKGPRTIDLDLLLFGDEAIDEPGLIVPHPELLHRPFAVVPILDIDPLATLPDGRLLGGTEAADRSTLSPWPMVWEDGP